jgi:hypothetical protein
MPSYISLIPLDVSLIPLDPHGGLCAFVWSKMPLLPLLCLLADMWDPNFSYLQPLVLPDELRPRAASNNSG